MTTSTRKILIDTDPGIDDAMAIFYALASPELEVVGLTTVYGNAHIAVCTTNALKLLEIADRTHIPVAKGVDGPLVMPYRGPAAFVHGTDGQGDVFLSPPTTKSEPIDAAQFIIRTVMDSPGEITLVALGPLTNIAVAMLIEPALTTHLAGIVLMGGNAFCGGNASPAAEANVLNDPEAADIVFGADCPMVMAGLDVTEQTFMSAADIAQFSTFGNARANHLAAITPIYESFYRGRNGLDGIFVHDSSTISYLLAPELYTWVEHPVRVDCGHSFCRGKTQTAARVSDHETEWSTRRPVRILTGVDSRAVVEMELERLRR
ncbi:MAG TPA: nucleoside hydrolase [Ilumatobacteraceae bacterium]|nr:nucleoside hydrolase [Ilumatobacteraceae bacterium]